jgi:hypothetical protein
MLDIFILATRRSHQNGIEEGSEITRSLAQVTQEIRLRNRLLGATIRCLTSLLNGTGFRATSISSFSFGTPISKRSCRENETITAMDVVARNLTRFGEGLPKTSYGEREVEMLRSGASGAGRAAGESRAQEYVPLLRAWGRFPEPQGTAKGRGSDCFGLHGCGSGLSTSAGTLMPHCFFPRG